MTIRFYKTNEPYGFLSNFSRHEFTLDGEKWDTAEHYFQSRKFSKQSIKDRIRSAKSPMDAALIGRDRNNTLVGDWEIIKDDVMRVAVFAKFSQNDFLKEALLSTGNSILIEHTKNDSYWGDGGNGTGRNMLGIILMEVRELLRNK